MGKRDRNRRRREKRKRSSSLERARPPMQNGTPHTSDLMHATTVTNGHSTPQHTNKSGTIQDEPLSRALVTEAQCNRVRPIVEFVYPRQVGSTADLMPYIFDRQRKRPRTQVTSEYDGEHEKGKHSIPVHPKDQASSSTPSPRKGEESRDETIDDILYGPKNAKKTSEKTPRQDTTERTPITTTKVARETAPELNRSEEETASPLEHTTSASAHETPNKNGDDTEAGHLSGLSVEDAVRDKHGCRPRANSTDFELKLPRRGLCDEKSVLECYKWKDPNRRCRPRGFVNCGNTCFLNATLQCLAYLPPFAQCLLSLPRSSNGSRPASNGQRITWLLSALFRQVHGADPRRGHHEAISPRAMVNAVPTLGGGASRNGYKFRPGRQEDAHEFLVHLLDAIHDGELKAAGINQQSRGWRDKLPIPRLDETTFVHRVFGGYLRSQVQCTKCAYRSNTYDPFLDLALEVSKKSCTDIADAFAEFTKEEKLDSDNLWKCGGCQKHVRATKQLTVFRGPLALCVQLKRFTYGGGFGGFSSYGSGGWSYGLKGASGMSGSGSKITKPIDFPSELRLPLSDGRKCVYGLTGIVIHVGGSSSSGHYTAFVKRPGPTGENRSGNWYQMDDSFVEPISERAVLRHRDAYLLFYCRKEVKLEFPSPPPRATMTAEEAREFGAARARAKANASHEKQKATSSTLSSPKEGSKRKPEVADKKAKVSKLSNSASSELSPASPPKARETSPRKSSDLSGVTGNPAESSSSSDLSSASDSDEDEAALPSKDANLEVVLDKREEISAETSVEAESDNKGRTRLVLDRGKMMGKLEVMAGPSYKGIAWKPKTKSFSNIPGEGQELLGNRDVGKWDDDEEGDGLRTPEKAQVETRKKVLKEIAKRERSRKRKLHLSRWDSTLDEGRRKKVKDKSEAAPMQTPKKNPFQRIQSSIQKMNRGRAKGFRHSGTPNRRKNRNRTASF